MDFNLFRSRPGGRDPAANPLPQPRSGLNNGSQWDPDGGITWCSVDDILDAHQELIDRIKLCYGSDRAGFETDLLVPIRNYASFVNVLPATADNFFCRPGGLFRLGLEVAFFALQGTDGHIVCGRSTITERRQFEPRWRHATFIAGLCCELHRTLSRLVVTDDHGGTWPSYLQPLTCWLQERGGTRLKVRWITGTPEHRGLTLFALPHIVPATTMQHLADGGTLAIPQMLSSLTDTPLSADPNVLRDLVKRAIALVVDRDLVAMADRQGKPILGAHLARYLLDAIRQLLVSHPAWTPNQERSRVWHASDGLFVVWPNAVSEIRKLLEEQELQGIPKSPAVIEQVLLQAGLLEPAHGGSVIWSIVPPPGGSAIGAVKIRMPESVLLPGSLMDSALRDAIVAPAATERTSTAAAPRHEVGSPAQAVLPFPPQSDDVAAPHPRSEEIVAAGVVRFRLMAPLRLNPQVCAVLATAIESMNGDAGNVAGATVAAGVFVPLDHFRRNGLDPNVATRALSEAEMLVTSKDSRQVIVHHDIRGKDEPGVVLQQRFVSRPDPAVFNTAE